jgi:hypothetical protein
MPTLVLPLWAIVLMIGMPAMTALVVVAAWVQITRVTTACHLESSRMLNNITAIAQTIAAQNRDVLRRLEEMGP